MGGHVSPAKNRLEKIDLSSYDITRGDEMNTKELIDKAVSLPVEERALVVDSLLRSLNQPESEIDKTWIAVAKRRLAEMRSGSVVVVPGQEVFEKIWKRVDT